MHEVIPFEEERLSRREREHVREAVAVVQAGAMPSLSKAAERAPRHLAVFRVNGYELDACPADEVIQVAQSLRAVSRFDDDGVSTNVATDIRRASAASMASMKARRSVRVAGWQRKPTCR